MKSVMATCAYEAARTYLDAWVDGVISAAAGHDGVEALIVIDGLADVATTFHKLTKRLPVKFVAAPLGSKISNVRKLMISSSASSEADMVIFCDADDKLTPDAIVTHRRGLERADISVGDLRPVDSAGVALADCMFGSDLPDIIVGSALTASNICGFSNTAARRDALGLLSGLPFPDVPAVDWWMFTKLLQHGARASGTRGIVAEYRQHDANTIGATGARDIEGAKQRLKIAAAHFRTFANVKMHEKAKLAEALAADCALLNDVMAQNHTPSKAWFGDVALWLEAVPLPGTLSK